MNAPSDGLPQGALGRRAVLRRYQKRSSPRLRNIRQDFSSPWLSIVTEPIDVEFYVPSESHRRGRFPRNEIISLLDVNRRYNLAESTAQDLTFGEIMDMAGGTTALGGLKMGYGSSAG